MPTLHHAILDHTRSDKSEIISYAISEYGLNLDRSVMVGDRKYDIIGAKNNGVKSIGVTYGYGSLQELLSQHPDFIINRPSAGVVQAKPAPPHGAERETVRY
jgi:phosphoglycolate phosphatase-like HAD superfamily hydrolase